MAGETSTIKDSFKIAFPGGANSEQIQKGIDLYCSDYRNVNLPVYVIVLAMSIEIRGAPKDFLETYFQAQRKIFNSRDTPKK